MDAVTFAPVLVLCTGNICRSVMAERLLCQVLPPAFPVTSAGIHALHDHPAESMSVTVAREHGLSLEGHTARRVTPGMLHDAGLILVMEPGHIEFVTSMAPEVRGKTLLFSYWSGGRAIPDPYRKSRDVYEYVYQQLDLGAQRWAQRLVTKRAVLS